MIRFQRVGKKNRPAFRLVLIDKRRAAKAGSFQEILGSDDRLLKQTKLNKDRIQYWIKNGAQPSDSAWNLLLKEGVISGKKRAAHARHPSKKTLERRKVEAAAEASTPSAA